MESAIGGDGAEVVTVVDSIAGGNAADSNRYAGACSSFADMALGICHKGGVMSLISTNSHRAQTRGCARTFGFGQKRFQLADVKMHASENSFRVGSQRFAAGSLIIRASENAENLRSLSSILYVASN